MSFFTKAEIEQRNKNFRNSRNYYYIREHMITVKAYDTCREELKNKNSADIIKLLNTVKLESDTTKYHGGTLITKEQKDDLNALVNPDKDNIIIATVALAHLSQDLTAQLCIAVLNEQMLENKKELENYISDIPNDQTIKTAVQQNQTLSQVEIETDDKAQQAGTLLDEIEKTHNAVTKYMQKFSTSDDAKKDIAHWITRDERYRNTKEYTAILPDEATPVSVVKSLSNGNEDDCTKISEIKERLDNLKCAITEGLYKTEKTANLKKIGEAEEEKQKSKKHLQSYSTLISTRQKLVSGNKALTDCTTSVNSLLAQDNLFNPDNINTTIKSLREQKTKLEQSKNKTSTIKINYSTIYSESTKQLGVEKDRQIKMFEDKLKCTKMALLRAQLIQYADNCVKLFTENPYIAIHFMQPVFLLLDNKLDNKNEITIDPQNPGNETLYHTRYNTCVETLSRQVSTTLENIHLLKEDEDGINLSSNSLQNWAKKNEKVEHVKDQITKQWENITKLEEFTKHQTKGTQGFYRDFFNAQQTANMYQVALKDETSLNQYVEKVKSHELVNNFKWKLKDHLFEKYDAAYRLYTSKIKKRNPYSSTVEVSITEALAQILNFLNEYHVKFTEQHNKEIKNVETLTRFFKAHKEFNDTYNAIEELKTSNRATGTV